MCVQHGIQKFFKQESNSGKNWLHLNFELIYSLLYEKYLACNMTFKSVNKHKGITFLN